MISVWVTFPPLTSRCIDKNLFLKKIIKWFFLIAVIQKESNYLSNFNCLIISVSVIKLRQKGTEQTELQYYKMVLLFYAQLNTQKYIDLIK